MRGKLLDKFHRCTHLGITPADAGKTLIDEATQENAEDHPRGCGENIAASMPISILSGSPPRMRGKH